MSQKKVLVVDDQYAIRLLLQEVFAKEPIRMFQAGNGMQALDLIQQEQPDLILLDMKMPGKLDGLEILRQLRAIGLRTKVIMMTAYGELDMITEAKRLGAVSHFTKPFDIEKIRSEVMRQLVS